ncbi:hypothetical protein ACF1GW_39195 [Streptomyces achromogenes]|uniref:hypothetical protein n=1 Tax=Streptomyces achromogenes TaxID=67255 RepID=UPI003700AFAD
MSNVSESRRAAQRHMQNRRRRLKAIGQWQPPFVDAEPVRAHVRALGEAGMSQAALIRRLNLPDEALKNLMRGANGNPPGKKVRRETAEAVLAYWPTLADFPDSASIDGTGTRRRVQALMTLGWSKTRLAIELEMRESNFKSCVRSATVSARFARQVAALYDRLWTERPQDYGVADYVVNRVQRFAREEGYHGPLAWDDDTIDDPKAEPLTDAVEPVASDGDRLAERWLMGESVVLDRAARDEVLQYLFEWTNDTTEEIAARLDMTPEAAERKWFRLKAKAETEGRRLWRRVYMPRERTLKQSEMEEAA